MKKTKWARFKMPSFNRMLLKPQLTHTEDNSGQSSVGVRILLPPEEGSIGRTSDQTMFEESDRC